MSSVIVVLLLFLANSLPALSQLKVTVPKIPQTELDTIVTQATLNVKRRLEVIEPSILASGKSCPVLLHTVTSVEGHIVQCKKLSVKKKIRGKVRRSSYLIDSFHQTCYQRVVEKKKLTQESRTRVLQVWTDIGVHLNLFFAPFSHSLDSFHFFFQQTFCLFYSFLSHTLT